MSTVFLNNLCRRWRVIVVASYSLAALSFSMPADEFPLKPVVGFLSSRALLTLSLWQYWDMFAPTPRSDDFKVEVIYLTADGERHSIFLTDMRSLGYFERWQKERWRKYFNDNLRTDAKKYLWEPYAVFFHKQLKNDGVTAVQIELVRHWRSAELPFSPGLRPAHRSSPWRTYKFYVWHSPSGKKPTEDQGG